MDQVVGDVDPVERLLEAGAGDGVADDDRERDLDAARVAREAAQLVALPPQPSREARADESADARYQDSHAPDSMTTTISGNLRKERGVLIPHSIFSRICRAFWTFQKLPAFCGNRR